MEIITPNTHVYEHTIKKYHKKYSTAHPEEVILHILRKLAGGETQEHIEDYYNQWRFVRQITDYNGICVCKRQIHYGCILRNVLTNNKIYVCSPCFRLITDINNFINDSEIEEPDYSEEESEAEYTSSYSDDEDTEYNSETNDYTSSDSSDDDSSSDNWSD